jgi:hypothetical protein
MVRIVHFYFYRFYLIHYSVYQALVTPFAAVSAHVYLTTLIPCGPSFLTIHRLKHFILAINRGWYAEWTPKTVQTCQRANVLFCVGTQMGVA